MDSSFGISRSDSIARLNLFWNTNNIKVKLPVDWKNIQFGDGFISKETQQPETDLEKKEGDRLLLPNNENGHNNSDDEH